MAMHRVTIHVTIQAILAAIAIHGVFVVVVASFLLHEAVRIFLYFVANCRMVLQIGL